MVPDQSPPEPSAADTLPIIGDQPKLVELRERVRLLTADLEAARAELAAGRKGLQVNGVAAGASQRDRLAALDAKVVAARQTVEQATTEYHTARDAVRAEFAPAVRAAVRPALRRLALAVLAVAEASREVQLLRVDVVTRGLSPSAFDGPVPLNPLLPQIVPGGLPEGAVRARELVRRLVAGGTLSEAEGAEWSAKFPRP